MQSGIRRFENTLILASILVVGAGLWWYFHDLNLLVYALVGILALIVVGGLLLFQPRWYQLLAFGLIPLSIDMEIGGGARMGFPSEALFVIALPVLGMFDADFRKAVKAVFLHRIGLLLIAILFVDLLTGLLGTHPDISIKRWFIKAIFLLTFLPMARLFSADKKGILPWLVYIAGLVPVMYFTLKKHASYGFDPRATFEICMPYYNDHTVYGACLAFCIPLLIVVWYYRSVFVKHRFWNWVIGLVLILLLVSEVSALSRAALLSLAVGGLFAFLLWFKVKFRAVVIGLLVLGTVVFFTSDSIYKQLQENEAVSNDGELVNHFSSITNVNSDASNLERINRWVCAWRMFEARPLLGFGPGTYQFEYNKFQSSEYKTYISTNTGDKGNAHSEYLTYLAETGIIGFILFVLLVAACISRGMKNHYALENREWKALNLIALLGLMTFFFHGLFNAFIDQVKMASLVYLAMGTIITAHQLHETKKLDRA